MYARMTVAQIKPEVFEDAASTIQEAFLPAAQAANGYSGFLILTDQGINQLIGISFWENEAAMQANGSADGYFQQRLHEFAGMVSAPPVTSAHKVAVREP